jgi:hypothetical protein
MAGDGVSLQTTLTQMGSVAKSQARAQQTATVPGQAQQLEKEEVKPLEKVRQAEKAEKEQVDADRRRERRRRRQKDQVAAADADADKAQEDEGGATGPGLGGLIDIKA